MPNNKREDVTNNLKNIFVNFIGTVDYTEKYREQERNENKTMAILSYILPIIPLVAERDSSYVKFHVNQGLNLFVWYILFLLFSWVLHTGFPWWSFITTTIQLIFTIGFIVLILYGVANSINCRAREIPIVSKLNLVSIISDFLGI